MSSKLIHLSKSLDEKIEVNKIGNNYYIYSTDRYGDITSIKLTQSEVLNLSNDLQAIATSQAPDYSSLYPKTTKEEKSMTELKYGNIYEVTANKKYKSLFKKGKEYIAKSFAGEPALQAESKTFYWGDELDSMGIELRDVTCFKIENGKTYIITDNNGTDPLFKENKIYKSKIVCNEPAIYSETKTPYWDFELKRMGIKLKELPSNRDYKFKTGQVYKVLVTSSEETFKEGKEYVVVELNQKPCLKSEDEIYYYDYDFGRHLLSTQGTYLELVKDVDEQKEKTLKGVNLHKPYEPSDTEPSKTVETPTIEVPWLVDYINDNDLSSYDITHFLKGYMKGIEADND